MSARDELAAQARMFLDTLALLADKKLNGAAASALLFGQAVPVIREMLGEIDFDAACDADGAYVHDDCDCCDVSYPRAEIVNGLCPTCVTARCGQDRPVGDHSAPGFAPAEALPMPAADGVFCNSVNPEHDAQVCSAQAGHPEKLHAMHGLSGRVVEFWPAGPVHWIDLDEDNPGGNACGGANGTPVRGQTVAASDKSQVTCPDCRALPAFGPVLGLVPDVQDGGA